MALRERRGNLWIGGIVVLLAGVLILLSTFMSWMGASTGWDTMFFRQVPAGGEANVAFFYQNGGYLLFTGLWTLIIGALLIISGAMILASMGTSMMGLAATLGFVGLVFSIFNMVTIARLDLGIGAGVFVFLIFSVASLVGASLVRSAPVVYEREAGYAPDEGEAYGQAGMRPHRRPRFGTPGEMQPAGARRHWFWRRRDYMERR